MMKQFYIFTLLMGFSLFSAKSSSAQNDVWSDSFFNGVAATQNQINAWDAWRASLKPGNYTFMTIKGTYDQTGYTCTDKTIVNDFASAVQNYSTYISSTTNGHVWSICNRYLGEIWIDPPSSCSGSNCPGPNGYIIRPGIGTGNSNWGGVNTNTCGGANQRMTFIFGKPSKPNDMGIDGIKNLEICASTQSLIAKFVNYGINSVDSFRINWSVNGNMQSTQFVTCGNGLISSKDTSITINPSFAFTNNTNYTFKFWTSKPNGTVDSVASNDTFVYKLNFLGNPSPPSTTDIKQCGNGRPRLIATPNVGTDSIMWFDKSTGGNMLGIGRNILGPYLTSSRTFYAQSVKFGGSNSFGTGFNGATIVSGDLSASNGNMFDVNVINSVVLDSFTFEIWNATPNTGFRLYYKVGTYLGNETNPNAWTQISSGQIRYFNSGGNFLARVSAGDLLLSGGTLYGFYYTTDPNLGSGNDVYLNNGTGAASNGDIAISGGRAIWGSFGSNGVYATWTGNFEMNLKKQCANTNRTAYTVTVKPRPTGADVVEGSPFDGTFQIGSMAQPDISEVGKTIVYQLVSPTGYTDAGHTSTWQITNLEARTRYGALVPPSEYTPTLPSGGGPGTIEITPKSFYLDSLITFSMTYMDLGPHFCDSTIVRTMIVAPTPEPKFRLPSAICVGEPIPFDNLSEIHSGNMSYKWFFGDGDSSDLVSPVHEYKTAGTKTIRLIATSFPWGRIKDTSMIIQVGEIPDVKFRVNNQCEGIAVTFQNQTTVGTGTLSYTWDFGDNSPTSTIVNPTHLYATPKGYKVTLTASANGCIAKLSKNAYMFARPDADFAAPLSAVCAKSEVLLPNLTTIALGKQGALWAFGDGGISTQFHGKHEYLTPGTYSIKLLAVSEFDCKDSITKSITIKETPNPDFNGDLFCGKKPTKFTNTTSEVIPNPVYAWKFSDGYTSTFKNVTRTWPYEGPFNATLTATYSNGCVNSINKTFEVLLQPVASFNVNDICSGEVAKFANNSTGDQSNIISVWDFGDGVTSNLWAPEKLYNPNSTTTYTVSLVSSYNGGCKDTMRKSLTVSESPICDFTFEGLGFRNTKFTPDNSTYASYSWLFGDGSSSENTSPTYKYAYSGKFNVTMKATNTAGCDCEVTKTVGANTDITNILESNNVSIYPNPNNGQFTISNTENAEMKIEIFNVLGVKISSIETDKSTANINLSNQSKGIYLIKVTVNGLTVTKKITIS